MTLVSRKSLEVFRILIYSSRAVPDLGAGIMMVGESKLPTSPLRLLVVSASKDLRAPDTTVDGEKVAGVAFHREPPGSAEPSD
jgi:hypothetical protein